MNASVAWNTSPGMSAQRIVFLDYLRIFAFVSVLVGHKFVWSIKAETDDAGSLWHWPARALWPWIQGGGVGVLVFFLVSGYVITQVLQRETTAEFLIKRVFRIYPLYMLAVLVEQTGLMLQGDELKVSVLLAQLLLIGDWLDTPYTLGGVEWTLRMEVLFYVFMACLHSLGLTRWRNGAALLWVYAICVAGLFVLKPWPTHEDWTFGYGGLYFPFLLLGSGFFLYERRIVAGWHFAGFVLLVLVLHYKGLQMWQPRWLDAHFGILALGLFTLAWLMRSKLVETPAVLWWSGLTYAVYLFHYWLFDWLAAGWTKMGWYPLLVPWAALCGLLLVCAILVRWVEQPAIRRGRRLSRRWAQVQRSSGAR